jgi:Domain of unknown function (DUF6265)
MQFLKSTKNFLISILFFMGFQFCTMAQDLERYQWLVGTWEGEAFGGKVFEHWGPPAGDEMLGSFQLVKEGKNSVLEFMAIHSGPDTTILYFNHYDPDLKRWEDSPIVLGLEFVDDNEFKFRNFDRGETAPRSLKYRYDKEKDLLIVVVEEWEKTSAGFESFSITYHKN